MKVVKNCRGFTLVEVLIAFLLLTVGLLGVAAMQSTAISSNAFAHSGTVAIQLGEEMVDRIRANAGVNPQRYNGIDTAAGCVGLVAPAAGDCADWLISMQNAQIYRPRGRVTVASDTPTPNVSTVTVTVSWGGSGGRTMTFTTILETWGT